MTACSARVWESTRPAWRFARNFGRMVALRGTKIVSVPLSEAVGTMRTLDPDFLSEAEEFFR